MDEIESAQRREWSDDLATAYANLGDAEAATRARTAEGWLGLAPDSVALLVAIGRLHVRAGNCEQAEEPLERALAMAPTSAAWEALGDCRKADGDLAAAATCYANALHVARAEAPLPLGPRQPRSAFDTRPISFEERSEHGVPRLPKLSG
jgi:HemY protein